MRTTRSRDEGVTTTNVEGRVRGDGVVCPDCSDIRPSMVVAAVGERCHECRHRVVVEGTGVIGSWRYRKQDRLECECGRRARWNLSPSYVVYACDRCLVALLPRDRVCTLVPLPEPKGVEAMTEAVAEEGDEHGRTEEG